MSAAHTPGTWVLIKTDHETMISDWHIQMGKDRVDVFPYKRIYSEDKTQSGLVTDDELMSNARLMAAAPELLEALKACAGICAGESMSKSSLIRALEMARAVITKATGVTT